MSAMLGCLPPHAHKPARCLQANKHMSLVLHLMHHVSAWCLWLPALFQISVANQMGSGCIRHSQSTKTWRDSGNTCWHTNLYRDTQDRQLLTSPGGTYINRLHLPRFAHKLGNWQG